MRVSYTSTNYGCEVSEDLDTILLNNTAQFAYGDFSDGKKAILLLAALIEMLHSKGIICDKNIKSFLRDNFSTIVGVKGIENKW